MQDHGNKMERLILLTKLHLSYRHISRFKCKYWLRYWFFHLLFCFQGYQFWTQTDKNGGFNIKNVRPGGYNLYAWVHGFIGDYKLDLNITIQPGKINLQMNVLLEPWGSKKLDRFVGLSTQWPISTRFYWRFINNLWMQEIRSTWVILYMILQEMALHCGKSGFLTGQLPSSSYRIHTQHLWTHCASMTLTSKFCLTTWSHLSA